MSEDTGRSAVDLNGCHSNNLKKEGTDAHSLALLFHRRPIMLSLFFLFSLSLIFSS